MHSILFKIGPVPIRAYGFMLWIALVAGLLVALRLSRKTNIKQEHVIDVALYSVLAGVVFAHLASILLDLPYYLQNPSEIFTLWKEILSSSGGVQGLSFHGGLVGALGAALLYTRRKRISFLAMADLLSPSLALGYGITRIGCFLNGCCYGIPTNLPWAVRFHVDGGLTPPSHPTQLYSALVSLLIFGLLFIIRGRSRFNGQVFLCYLALYSVYRFMIEFLRKGVTADVALWGLTQAQIVSIVMFAITVPLIFLRVTREGEAPAEPIFAKSGKHSKKQKAPGHKPKSLVSGSRK